MTDEQFKALAVVGVLLATVSGGGGFTAGRMSAPVPPPVIVEAPPPEIQHRIVEVPVFVPVLPGKTTDRVDQEPIVEPKAGEDAAHAPPPAAAAPAPRKPHPKVKAKPEKKSDVKKPRTVATTKRKPTASECALLRGGIAAIGRDGVVSKASGRGYSAAQVNWAISACGI